MHFVSYKIRVGSDFAKIQFPPICPHCNLGIAPEILHISELTERNNFGVLFLCPSCKQFIFYTYYYEHSSRFGYFKGYYPKDEISLDIPKEIEKFSPRFIKIFTQSLKAYHHNYDEIVGVGLRKSIEFLVKDYLIHIKHKDETKISNMNLGSVFKEINDSKLSPLITAIAWIGNDETHYIRKHEEKTVEDMLNFINALIYAICFELSLNHASSFIASSIAK